MTESSQVPEHTSVPHRGVTAEEMAKLTESAAIMAAETSKLREDVKAIDRKAKQDRSLLYFQGVTSLLLLLLVGGLVLVGLGNRANGEVLRDCIDPNGSCAQRSARQTAAVVISITYRTEAERLRSEIQVAQRQGQTQAVEARQARLAEVEGLIAQQDEVADAVRNNRPIPAVTTVPAPTPIPAPPTSVE